MEKTKIVVIGLGYVGLPLARSLSTKYECIGFDLSQSRVGASNSGHDMTLEVSDDSLWEAIEGGFKCTSNIDKISNCNPYVVAVPTPVDLNNRPGLTPLIGASTAVGKVISEGDIVVYESTVYPGVTRGGRLPVVEKVSRLAYNADFYAGYSPERIDPGDKEYIVEKIKRVTFGPTPEIADIVDSVYDSVLVSGTHKASSIKAAEASKIIENSRRDVNITFVNEFSKIFNVMGIDINDVIKTASSKWNFIKLKPGLVGGHCISVDSHYLIQKTQVYGVLPRIMSAVRRLNDGTGDYVVNQVIRLMNKKGIPVKGLKVLLLGSTFKEDYPDIRNIKVIDIYPTLHEYTSDITVYDAWVNLAKVAHEYGVSVLTAGLDNLVGQFDVMVLRVGYKEFRHMNIRDFLRSDAGVAYDVKAVLSKSMIDDRL